MRKAASYKYSDVDQGWAWLVLTANYLGFFLRCCTYFSLGVFYVALLEKYGEGKAKTSLVGAICTGVTCIFSPVASGFINRFGCRASIFLGSAILTVSGIVSGFVQSLNCLIVSAGLLAGFGHSFSVAGLIVCLGFYFDRWKDQVISLLFGIIGLSLCASSPLGIWMLETYGLSGAFIATSWLNIQLCVVGTICRPSSIELEILNERGAGRFVFTIQLGLFVGVPNALMTIITIHLIGSKSVSEAHGFSYFACGVGILLGPVSAGFVYDWTGSYSYSFVVVGSVLLVGSVLSFLVWLLDKRGGHAVNVSLDIEELTALKEEQPNLLHTRTQTT